MDGSGKFILMIRLSYMRWRQNEFNNTFHSIRTDGACDRYFLRTFSYKEWSLTHVFEHQIVFILVELR